MENMQRGAPKLSCNTEPLTARIKGLKLKWLGKFKTGKPFLGPSCAACPHPPHCTATVKEWEPFLYLKMSEGASTTHRKNLLWPPAFEGQSELMALTWKISVVLSCLKQPLEQSWEYILKRNYTGPDDDSQICVSHDFWARPEKNERGVERLVSEGPWRGGKTPWTRCQRSAQLCSWRLREESQRSSWKCSS